MAAIQPAFVGLDMFLYYNTGNFASPVWAQINCRDLKKGRTTGEADVSNRGSKNKLLEPTLIAREYTFDIVTDQTDTAFVALQTAYFARTNVEFALANGPIGTSGTVASGGTANVVFSRITCKIFGFEDAEPLDGADITSVTAKPSKLAQTNAPSDNSLVA